MTKLSAQISVLMAKSSTSSVDNTLRESYQRKGTFRTAMNIVTNRGVGGLYSGFSLHLCEYQPLLYLRSYVWNLRSLLVRDTIGTAIYFTTYESSKQLLVKFQGSSSPTSPSSVAVAGGLCGLVSWACVSLYSPEKRDLNARVMAYTWDRFIQSTRRKHTISVIVWPNQKGNRSRCPEFSFSTRECTEVLPPYCP